MSYVSQGNAVSQSAADDFYDNFVSRARSLPSSGRSLIKSHVLRNETVPRLYEYRAKEVIVKRLRKRGARAVKRTHVERTLVPRGVLSPEQQV